MLFLVMVICVGCGGSENALAADALIDPFGYMKNDMIGMTVEHVVKYDDNLMREENGNLTRDIDDIGYVTLRVDGTVRTITYCYIDDGDNNFNLDIDVIHGIEERLNELYGNNAEIEIMDSGYSFYSARPDDPSRYDSFVALEKTIRPGDIYVIDNTRMYGNIEVAFYYVVTCSSDDGQIVRVLEIYYSLDRY